MKKIYKYLVLLPLMMSITTGCNNSHKPVEEVVYVRDPRFKKSINGRATKKRLNILGQIPDTSGTYEPNLINTTEYGGELYIYNVSAGLVGTSEFGTSELLLAESARHNEDYTEYTFTLRDDENMIYITSKGQPYKVGGQTQRVRASDFEFGLKLGLSVQNTYVYNAAMFLRGGIEYIIYCDCVNNGFSSERTVEEINKYLDQSQEGYHVTVDDLGAISRGERLGVSSNDETREVTYTLKKPCYYFVPYLINAPYLPVCYSYYKEMINNDKIYSSLDYCVYSGPYYPSKYKKETKPVQGGGQGEYQELTLLKNPYYDNIAGIYPDNKAYIQEINIMDNPDNGVKQYFEGSIDFYSDYLTNYQDNKAAYIDNDNNIVEVSLDDTSIYWNTKINAYYGSFINMGLHRSYARDGHDLNNTQRALRLNDVRKLLLRTYDYDYYVNKELNVYDNIDNMVHTLTPYKFCFDNSGNEYTTTYLAGEYSKQKDISLEDANKYLQFGQYNDYQYSQEEIIELANNAINAIDLYNANTELVNKYGEISYPITFEYFSRCVAGVPDDRMVDKLNTLLTNILGEGKLVVKYIPLNNQSEIDKFNGSFDYCGALWGQIGAATYSDPSFYLNSFVNDMWAEIFPYLTEEYIADIVVEDNNVKEIELLGKYKEILSEADSLYDVEDRYTKMAEAEYELLENVNIYAPRKGEQHREILFSKMTSVGLPEQCYNALGTGRLTGLWVLEVPLTSDEVDEMEEEEDDYQGEYFEDNPDIFD